MDLRRRSSRIGLALTTVLFGGALAGCSDNPAGTSPPPPPPSSETILSGTLTASQTLDASKTYKIQGTVVVADGVTLTIPAGTTLLGDVNFTGSALIVRQGAKLMAVGTPANPIVFTSSNPPDTRARGDWGGVVLAGRSICNFSSIGEDCVGEGNAGPYGGTINDDNSGVLKYVRIEYAGYEVSFGNELNGLTLNGVGSGTQIDFVQSHYGSDDGIEIFGGTVDLKHAIVTGASDDSFDWSTGWEGRGQFWVAQQDPDDGDNGFEVDGNESDYNATPFTDPLIYNVTLVGKEAGTGTAGESPRGILFRRGTAGDTYNVVVLGFEKGIDIDNAETVGRVAIRNSYFFGSGTTFEGDDDNIDEQAIVMTPAWNNVAGVNPALQDPFNRSAPDFRPTNGSPLLSGYATPPSDGFFDAVDYIGGVDPIGTPWYEGWITTDRN
jgi:hypothetical protein